MQSFIIRIWFEETNGENGTLVRRGSIEHVGSKRCHRFQDEAEILKFIDEQLSADRASHARGGDRTQAGG